MASRVFGKHDFDVETVADCRSRAARQRESAPAPSWGSCRTALGFGTPRFFIRSSASNGTSTAGGSPPVLSRLVTSPTDSIVIGCRPETVTWSLMNCVSGGLMSSSSGFCDRRLSFWQPASDERQHPAQKLTASSPHGRETPVRAGALPRRAGAAAFRKMCSGKIERV